MRTIAAIVLVAVIGVPALAGPGPVVEMPADVRSEIEKYLGAGVVGAAIETPVIDDPASFLGLTKKSTFVVRDVHGDDQGKTHEVTLEPLARTNGRPTWRLDPGGGAWYGEVQENGDVVQHSTEDKKNGVVSRYDPPEPVLLKRMRAGDVKRMKINVQVFDLAPPTRKEHSGYLNLVYTYVGAYKVTVPAGTFDCVLYSWKYDGKVGPANVKDDQYWFFAEGVGPVARIDMKNISAMLVYHDTAKDASVLVKRR